MDTPETIAVRLKRLRLERDLSQRELAVPGVSYAYISRIEAGSRQPSVKALRRLATRLGVTPEYLEFGTDMAAADERELRIAEAELTLRLGDGAAAEATLHDLFEASVRAGESANAARARIALALAAGERGDHASAVTAFEEAFALERPSPAERHDVFATLGPAYCALGHGEKAIELYRWCLAEVARLAPDNRSLQTRYRIYLSYALSDVGALDQADEVLREALDDSVESDPQMRIRLHWSLARLSEMEGESAVALRHARRAIALLEATEDDYHEARAHLLAAWIMNSAGDARNARAELEKARRLFGNSATGDDVAMLAVEESRAAALLGLGEEAEQLARDAIAAASDRYGAVHGGALCALGAALVIRDDAAEAERAYAEGVELLVGHRRWREAAEACRSWADALHATGREREAQDALARAAALAERTTQSALSAAS